jgi:ADP-ribosylglycohydrolase
MAVAAAAAIVTGRESVRGNALLERVLDFIPESSTREGIERSLDIAREDHTEAVVRLGTGFDISAQDTVPYSLWCVAHFGDDFVEAMWRTVSGLGDCDTTCAIVGGIIACAVPAPPSWIERREPLPDR